MKKTFIILCLLAFCFSLADAGITDKLKMVIARKNVAASAESEEACSGACLWVSSWSGSSILNAGTSYVWDSETDGDGELAQVDSAGACFNGAQAKCLEFNGTSNTATYIQEDSNWATATFGMRLAFYVTSESFTDNHEDIFVGYDSANTGFVLLQIEDISGTLYAQMRCRDSADTWQDVGSPIAITTGKWWQIVMKYDNDAANGANWTLYDSDGIEGSEQTASFTTDPYALDYIRFGPATAVWVTSSYKTDVLIVTNTYAYPSQYSW
jgi:hypothetical protein